MDEKITDVLTILDREDSPSQREIAKQTGFSVGLVNTLIKKCAKKGLVKIERLNSRNIKYILTPEGIKEKTQKTIDYIKRSYHAISELQTKVEDLANKHISEGRDIYIIKEDDEIFSIVTDTLKIMGAEYEVINNIKDMNEIEGTPKVIFYWDPNIQDGLKSYLKENLFRI
jgi:DNA-binding MarR family transcriptional regulator